MANKELDQLIAQLRSQKIRITDQRLAILKYMITHHNHPTAEDVYNDLKDTHNNISIATVYNNLRFLVKVTPIRELTYVDKSIHFDYFHKEHFHAICDQCGQIFDVNYSDYSTLLKNLKSDSAFQINNVQLNIHGICPDCQKRLASAGKSW
ncbi:transcriptional repressor [Lactobacillus sp. W8089]|nr:transcriptional repressor [Lactobacillus sp. W8086]MBI0109521.1 transcriptional repressor [Lactobacillus sp. W8085]MBI0112755.1 transcriptional repressor [Lactobacillus sp. W8088]MBI0116453.1 transcriptional repressor [Lactobacillus sp. W8087]MBI0120197.1 transcriptional repressor [Lactobacillus sp. W8089]MBI0132143.1 transcriptional repressor [Lactobacillus sp. W8090]